MIGSLVYLLLLAATFYVLARADNWSQRAAVLLSAGVFVVPFAVISASYRPTVVGSWASSVEPVIPIGIMIVLFALAKSVANRVRQGD